MATFISANTKVFLRDILPMTALDTSTFRISEDLESISNGSPTNIETGGIQCFFVMKNATQIERFLITATGGVATIIKRGLKQDGITEDTNLKKTWNDGTIGYITSKPDDFISSGKLDTI